MDSIERIAKVAHEANRAYCQSLGDDSQLPWEESPDWQRNSAIQGVLFHLENPGTSPNQSHENWMRQKVEEGWTYGPIKDPELKQHPCMVPYDQLPVTQQVKDLLFSTIVDTMRLTLTTPKMHRGDVVRALKDLDLTGAKVKKGDEGVVYETGSLHERWYGPMVRWFNGTTCNVYFGQVEVVSQKSQVAYSPSGQAK